MAVVGYSRCRATVKDLFSRLYKNPDGRNNWNPPANYEKPLSDPSQTPDLSPPGAHQTSSDYLSPRP